PRLFLDPQTVCVRRPFYIPRGRELRLRGRLTCVALLATRVERGEAYEARRERMAGLVAELRERTAQVARGGGERAVERHRGRGKLTARERIDRLVDPDTAF